MEYLDYDFDDEMDSVIITSGSIELLKLSENPDSLSELLLLMKSKAFLNLYLRIDGNLPYYDFEADGTTRRLYVNPELEEYLLHYLLSGNTSCKTPDPFFEGYKVGENYILIHLKREKNRGVTTYRPLTLENKPYSEFKAKYPFGTIHYGSMPLSKEQMINKLENLK